MNIKNLEGGAHNAHQAGGNKGNVLARLDRIESGDFERELLARPKKKKKSLGAKIKGFFKKIGNGMKNLVTKGPMALLKSGLNAITRGPLALLKTAANAIIKLPMALIKGAMNLLMYGPMRAIQLMSELAQMAIDAMKTPLQQKSIRPRKSDID